MDYPTEETRHLYAPYLQESHFYHPDHHFYYSARLQQGSYKKKTKRVPKEKKKVVKTPEGKKQYKLTFGGRSTSDPTGQAICNIYNFRLGIEFHSKDRFDS